MERQSGSSTLTTVLVRLRFPSVLADTKTTEKDHREQSDLGGSKVAAPLVDREVVSREGSTTESESRGLTGLAGN